MYIYVIIWQIYNYLQLFAGINGLTLQIRKTNNSKLTSEWTNKRLNNTGIKCRYSKWKHLKGIESLIIDVQNIKSSLEWCENQLRIVRKILHKKQGIQMQKIMEKYETLMRSMLNHFQPSTITKQYWQCIYNARDNRRQ